MGDIPYLVNVNPRLGVTARGTGDTYAIPDTSPLMEVVSLTLDYSSNRICSLVPMSLSLGIPAYRIDQTTLAMCQCNNPGLLVVETFNTAESVSSILTNPRYSCSQRMGLIPYPQQDRTEPCQTTLTP